MTDKKSFASAPSNKKREQRPERSHTSRPDRNWSDSSRPDNARSDRSRSDRPRSDRPRSDSNESGSNKSGSNKSGSNWSDAPRQDRERPNKSEQDRSQQDRARPDKSQQDRPNKPWTNKPRPSTPKPYAPRDLAPAPRAQEALDAHTEDTGSTQLDEAQNDAPPVLGGAKPVLELLEREPARVDMVLVRKGRRTADTDRILDICRTAGVRFSLCDAAALDRLCPAGHQGVAARLFESGFTDFEDLLRDAPDAPLPLLVALDQVQDTGNAGTLARTLYALGGAGLIVPRHNGVYLGAGARRAAAGALELLPVARVTNLARALDEARDAGYTIYGAGAETAQPEPDQTSKARGPVAESVFAAPLYMPAVLVLGSEEHGLRPQVQARCDRLLSIPMLRTFDSLNVAQAGAAVISCFLRAQLSRTKA